MDSIKEKEFLDLINNNNPMVQKVCCLYTNNSEDRKDLEQEIRLQLWRSYSNFEGRAKISTWMYRVALNTAITFLKKTTKINNTEKVCQDSFEIHQNNEDENLKAQFQEMYRAIEKLSKIEKAFIMLYIDEKNYSEISEILGISEGNARIKLMRIKEKLRTILIA